MARINYENHKLIVSVSGGKDSTAMVLNLLDNGYTQDDFVCVFADTGWETKQTYEYLDYLETKIGPIIRLKRHIQINPDFKNSITKIESLLGFESPMIRYAYKNQFFSNPFNKWCTKILKIDPFVEYFDSMDEDVINLVGIRREESPKRAKMDEWEWAPHFDCWTHRPLINWTEKQVIDIHHRFGIIPNNLYLTGYNRVGCYPCIYSTKEEISMLDEQRIRIIEIMESDWDGYFFRSPRAEKNTKGIRKMVDWAKTRRGGKQYQLFNQSPPTCVKWGLCSRESQ